MWEWLIKKQGPKRCQRRSKGSLGKTIQHYFRDSFGSGVRPPTGEARRRIDLTEEKFEFKSELARKAFDSLVDSFIRDYMVRKIVADRCGWRTITEIAQRTDASVRVFYGKHGGIGPALAEPINRGVIETRYFPGERGRGGEVMRFRIAYEREPVRGYVNQRIRSGTKEYLAVEERPKAAPGPTSIESPLPFMDVGPGARDRLVGTGVPSLDRILGAGYPDQSNVLVTGPPGIGKEALGYWFMSSGLNQGDRCLYVTHRVVADVLRDMSAFGVRVKGDNLTWIAGSGSPLTCDLNDISDLAGKIKEVVQDHKQEKHTRIVLDVLSPLLALNPQDSTYRFWSGLLAQTKQREATLFATMEDGMHPPNLATSMEQLFDGVIEMRIYEEGLSFRPLLRVRKMLGIQPIQTYFRFTFTRDSMELVADVN